MPHPQRRAITRHTLSLFLRASVPLCLSALVNARFCAAGIFPSQPFSNAAAGTTSAAFLKTPPTARFEALAGAGAAVKAPDAFFCNPAGTASLEPGRPALLLGYESLLENSGRTSFAALKRRRNATIGLGVLYRYEAGLEKYDALGAAGGSFNAYDAAFIGSYARRFERLDLGLAMKFIRSGLYDRAAHSAALDIGAVFREGRASDTELALTARNLGFPMKLGSRTDPLPFELSGALHWRYASEFSVLIEGKLPVDHAPYLIVAGEYVLALTKSSGLSLRAGLNFRNYSSLGVMGALASGFGVRLGGTSLDYAYVPYGDLGVTHRFTLGWSFRPGVSSARTGAPPPGLPPRGPAIPGR